MLPLPAVKFTLGANEFATVNVTTKGTVEYAVRLFVVTVIGEYVAPVGTVTVSDDALAAVTVAFTAPKYTILLAGVVLKFVPEIVTDMPIAPEVGLKDVMVGACPKACCEKQRSPPIRRRVNSVQSAKKCLVMVILLNSQKRDDDKRKNRFTGMLSL